MTIYQIVIADDYRGLLINSLDQSFPLCLNGSNNTGSPPCPPSSISLTIMSCTAAIPGAAAVGNAIKDAVGARVTTLPIRAPHILAQLP